MVWPFMSTRKLIFVGPPRSGKTVFFSTMISHLIQRSNEEKPQLRCYPRDTKSNQFVQSVMRTLKAQSWPIEGGAAEANGALSFDLAHLGRFYNTNYILSCFDYAGESFQAAFGAADRTESDIDHEQVERLRKEVEEADIVFVVVDAVRLLERCCPEIEDSLFGLAKTLREKSKKTGFVLTQRDEFEGREFEAQEKLKEYYASTYSQLRKINTAFFWIASVRAVTDSDGNRVPPKNYNTTMSIDLLKPIQWALGLPDQG